MAQRPMAAEPDPCEQGADHDIHFIYPANPEEGITPPAAQRLSEMDMPVLALAGELDTPDFRQITALIGRGVPQARAMIVPGVGHMANMEAPEEVTEALVEFLLQARQIHIGFVQ